MPPETLLQILQQLPGEYHSNPIMSPSTIAAADMTVLEGQIALLQWQLQQNQRQLQSHPQQQPSYFAAATAVTDTSLTPTPYSIPQPPHILPSSTVSLHATDFCGEQGMMIGHDLPSGSAGVWPDLAHYPLLCNSVPGSAVAGGAGEAMSGTFSCLPFVGKVESGRRLSPLASQLEHASTTKDVGAIAAAVPALSTERARESSKKRKSTERAGTTKLEEDDKAKKMIKVENIDNLVVPKVESPSIVNSSTAITTNNCDHNNNRETSSSASKEKPDVPEPPPKTEYIHVRARRGQATDSHSLAERVRREKISERMKLLQDLVPGCHKITGKAGMLDEIINYVQSLQRQVEFLSMKLAAVTPALDFNLDALITNEMSTLAGACGIPPQMGLPPELLGLSFLQYNPLQQQAMAADCGGLPVPMVTSCTPAEVVLDGIATAPVSTTTESCLLPDSCNNILVHPPPTKPAWDGDLQRFYSSIEEYEQGTTPTASVPADASVSPSPASLLSPR